MAKRRAESQIGNLTSDHWKSRIDPISLREGDMQHIVEKLSTRAIALHQTSSQSEVYTQSYRAPKIAGVLTLTISRLPFGSPRTKCHLDVGLMERHIVYYKGKVVASPKSRPWWVLWVRVCLWLVLTPKVFQLCINQLVVWFCVGSCEWVSACHSS
jgi:hypothetical protein